MTNDVIIALTCVAYGNVDDFRIFINYHNKIGITKFYFTIDSPDSDTIRFLSQTYGVTYRVKNINHKDFLKVQLENLNWAYQLSQGEKITWLGHFDLDEKVHSPINLIQLVESVSDDIGQIIFPTIEVQPLSDKMLFRVNIKYFRRKIIFIIKSIIYFILTWSFIPTPWFAGHSDGKYFLRITSNNIEFGIHRCEMSHLERSFHPIGSRCLHYDNPNFKIWSSKWLRRIKTGHDDPYLSTNRKKEQIRFNELFTIDKITEDYYNNTYSLTQYQLKVLRKLGLLIKV